MKAATLVRSFFWLVTHERESRINGDLFNKKFDFCYCDLIFNGDRSHGK